MSRMALERSFSLWRNWQDGVSSCAAAPMWWEKSVTIARGYVVVGEICNHTVYVGAVVASTQVRHGDHEGRSPSDSIKHPAVWGRRNILMWYSSKHRGMTTHPTHSNNNTSRGRKREAGQYPTVPNILVWEYKSVNVADR